MMNGYGWSWGWLLVLGVLAVLVIGGIVLAVVFASRGSDHPVAPSSRDPAASRSQAKAILEERFARGEIDDEEFRRRSETVRRSGDNDSRRL